eukprot:scaffold26462_cov46-Phaeocystis_antarctica.AAC.2
MATVCPSPHSPLLVRGGHLYTRSRSCSLLTLYINRRIWPERCSLAPRSGGLRGRVAGTGTA